MSLGYLLSLHRFAGRRRLAVLACAGLLLSAGTVLAAAPEAASAASTGSAASEARTATSAASTTSAASDAASNADAYTYRIPLLRQYAEQGVTLLGQDAYAGMNFGLRRDERVIGARLDLDFSYSPTLLPAVSHLNVLINSIVSATIPLPQPASRNARHLIVDLPLAPLSAFNHLNLELIAHSKASDQGNDPQSADLWLKAGPNSVLELTVVPAGLAGDLAALPAPFFDERDVRRLDLPVVLPRAPGAERLESAGIVTSWLGAQAGYRGAHFTAMSGAIFGANSGSILDAIPAHGHAVVLALRGELPDSSALFVPGAAGPALAILPNPHDPNGKLLLITGRNEAELRAAARTLVLGSRTLSGPFVSIDKPVSAAPRKPYDAPNWLPSDRPVQLGELLPAERLTVQGFQPGAIDVGLHLPPGLFGFDNDGAQLNLRYRYTARPESAHSALQVLAGNTPLQTLPLPGDASEGVAVMPIPTYLLPPLTTLHFDYRYEAVKTKDNWQDTPGGPLESAIDPASTIDISHLPRYAAMPDLRAFGDAGFPFTRLADLSGTAVILPVQPSAADYSAYLTLMGAMGQATGYPVLGVTVGEPAQADALRDKDLLVLASGDNQPLLKTWRDELPRGFFGPQAQSSGAIPGWWQRLTRGNTSARRDVDTAALYGSSEQDGMVAGLESPLAHGRSVVVVSANSPHGLDEVVNLLQANRYLTGQRRNDTSGGNLVIVHDGALTTLSRDQSYFIGSLPLWIGLQWFFASHIVLLLVATVLSILLIGLIGGVFLHRLALRRLDLDVPQTLQREEGRRNSHV